MILVNYRGKRTLISAFLALTGSALIIWTELFTGELTYYYYGAITLLIGIWVNGSFYFFYRQWIKPLIIQIQSLTDQPGRFKRRGNLYEEK